MLALRDCGSPVDTRAWTTSRTCRGSSRAGRHIAAPRRYIPGPRASRSSRPSLADEVRVQARRGDGWVKLVGDWIDRGVGDLGPSGPPRCSSRRIAAAHEAGALVTAHTFGTDALRA